MSPTSDIQASLNINSESSAKETAKGNTSDHSSFNPETSENPATSSDDGKFKNDVKDKLNNMVDKQLKKKNIS